MNKIRRGVRLGVIILLLGIGAKDYFSTSNLEQIYNQVIEKVRGKTTNITGVLDQYDEILAKEDDIGKLHEVNLVRVVDGDTIVVTNDNNEETKVRLIGIDTPESVNPDESKNTEYGNEASDYTKQLLNDVSTVYLEYDEELQDQYGRTLAYVWLDDIENTFDTKEISQYMLNAIIVKNGYAVAKEYKPNTMYASYSEELMNEAIENKEGLWSDNGYVSLVRTNK